MALLSPLRSLPWAGLAFSASSRGAPTGEQYRFYTQRCFNSGIRFEEDPETGLSGVCPKNAKPVVDVPPQLRDQGNWDRSYLEDLAYPYFWRNEPPWYISQSVWAVIPKEQVEQQENGHGVICEAALRAFALHELAIPFFGSGQNAEEVLKREVNFCDHHPTQRATYYDLLVILFSPRTNLLHGLRSTGISADRKWVAVDDEETARMKIREVADEYLTALRALQEKLDSDSPLFSLDESNWLDLFEERIMRMEEAYRERNFPYVVDSILGMKPFFFYYSMRAINLPRNFSDEKVLGDILEPYLDLRHLIRAARVNFQAADPQTSSDEFNNGVEAFKRALRYIPERHWDKLGTGIGPWTAQGQLRLAALVHLVQDWVAHCRQWRRRDGTATDYDCQLRVTNNLWGLGPLHEKRDDSLRDPFGRRKPQVEMAVRMTEQVLLLLQIRDPEGFKVEKEAFLTHYFGPAECSF